MTDPSPSPRRYHQKLLELLSSAIRFYLRRALTPGHRRTSREAPAAGAEDGPPPSPVAAPEVSCGPALKMTTSQSSFAYNYDDLAAVLHHALTDFQGYERGAPERRAAVLAHWLGARVTLAFEEVQMKANGSGATKRKVPYAAVVAEAAAATGLLALRFDDGSTEEGVSPDDPDLAHTGVGGGPAPSTEEDGRVLAACRFVRQVFDICGPMLEPAGGAGGEWRALVGLARRLRGLQGGGEGDAPADSLCLLADLPALRPRPPPGAKPLAPPYNHHTTIQFTVY
jgi:hypothetical protein